MPRFWTHRNARRLEVGVGGRCAFLALFALWGAAFSKPGMRDGGLSANFAVSPLQVTLESQNPTGSQTKRAGDSYRRLRLGVDARYFSYAEEIDVEDVFAGQDIAGMVGEPKSTEYGLTWGFRGALDIWRRLLENSGILVTPSWRILVGSQHTYDGSSQAEDSLVYNPDDHTIDTMVVFYPIVGTKNNLFVEGGLAVGWFHDTRSWFASLTQGGEARLWVRALGPGVEERYFWVTAPVQFRGGVRLSPRFSLAGKATFSPMVYGQMELRYIDGYEDHARGDVVALGRRHGFRLAAEASWQLTRRVGLHLEPFYEQYRFGKSDEGTLVQEDNFVVYTGTFFEPASTTHWSGAYLSLLLSF